MKNLFSPIKVLIAILSLGIAPGGVAQEPARYGFLNLVNLVPGEKNCKISISGKDVVPEGLPASQSTGWFIVPAGAAAMGLQVEGFDNASGSIDIVDTQSSIYVIFLEKSRSVDKDGKPLRPKIRIKRCDALAAPETGFQLKAMSFFPEENRFLIGQESVNLKLFDAVAIPKWAGGGLKVTHNQKLVGTSLPETEKGSFYLFFGTDHADQFSCALVRAERQDLPPWMKQKDSKP